MTRPALFRVALASLGCMLACGEADRPHQDEAAKPAVQFREQNEQVGRLAPHGPDGARDRYEARALGFEIHKPHDWVFLPMTSLPADTEERVESLEGLWDVLGAHQTVPLVALSTRVDPRRARDPVVRISSHVQQPTQNAMAIWLLTANPPTNYVQAFAQKREGQPGFEIVEPAQLVEISGLPGATIRVRYRLADDAGDEHPVEERITFVKQGLVFWLVEQAGAGPLEPAVELAFQEILDSIVLAPPFEMDVPPPQIEVAPQRAASPASEEPAPPPQ